MSARRSDAPLAVVVLDRQGRLLSGTPAFDELVGLLSGRVLQVAPLSGERPPEPRSGEATASIPLLVDGRVAGALVLRGPEEGVPAESIDEGSAEAASRDATEQLRAINEVLVAYADLLLEQQEELRAANRELKRLAAVKDEFLSMVSHELRTPLAALRNAISILRKQAAGPLTSQQDTFVRLMSEQVLRLNRMVDETLDFQKLQSGMMGFHFTVGDLRRVAEQSATSFIHLMDEQGVALEVAFGDEALIARFDEDKLLQVLLNLLSNAAKFSLPGGRVRLTAGRRGQEIMLTVSDEGPGIEPADLERIFDAFVQVDHGGRPEAKGTGLGLAICKQLMIGQEGRIWAESEPGRGSTFYLALPAFAPEVV